MLQDTILPTSLDSIKSPTQEKVRSLNKGISVDNIAFSTVPSSLAAAHRWLKTDYERVKHERDMLRKAFQMFSQQTTF